MLIGWWMKRFVLYRVGPIKHFTVPPHPIVLHFPFFLLQTAFETPVARRSRARPQSWHGSNPPPGSANGGVSGTMQAPMSTMSARSVAGGGGSVGGSSSKSRAADHMLFYSVCQATFYVMCFRGDELAGMGGFSDQVPRR